MCRFLLSWMILCSLADTTFSQSQSTFKKKHESNLDFSIDYDVLNDNTFQYYIAFLDRKQKKYNIDNHHFILPNNYKELFSSLDIYNYWTSRDPDDEQPYYTIFSKTVFLSNKNYTYFTKNKLLNLDYIQSTLPNYKVTKKSKDTFHVNAGLLSLKFDFNISYYDQPRKNTQCKKFYRLIDKTTNNLPQKTPAILTIQHNYNYNKLFFMNTGKMSIVIQTYYPIKKNKTLIINYALNYINNFPPEFTGGGKSMLDNILDNINDVIYSNNHYIDQ